MFNVMVGRIYFRAKKAKIYGAFNDEKRAKEYAEFKQCDLTPNSVLFVATADGDPIFLAEDGKNWKKYATAIVYDCTEDNDEKLSYYLDEDELAALILDGLKP